MTPDLHDTIAALATAPGPGGRAIVRLSGTQAITIAAQIFASAEPLRSDERHRYEGRVGLEGLTAPLPADLYVWPAPRSYSGQNLAELHTWSCPPLIDLLVAQILDAGARAAQPGEFTMRAFLAGKLDLTRAEAVLGVIEAGSRDELNQALAQLAGGVAQPLQNLRNDLLDLLADVEAALDFAEEDIRLVEQKELLERLTKGMAFLAIVQRQLEQRAVARRTFRAVLVGKPNTGKTSLFNALTGADALVSEAPGTTRDYLCRTVRLDEIEIELIDTAGTRETGDVIESAAQGLGRDQADQADLLLRCVEAAETTMPTSHGRVLTIATKSDLFAAQPSQLATSVVTGAGLDRLRRHLREYARAKAAPPLAPSTSRCRHHVQAGLDHLRQAHSIVLFEEPAEILALELRETLDELGAMVGAIYTDDLLDRIFSRFCIGK